MSDFLKNVDQVRYQKDHTSSKDFKLLLDTTYPEETIGMLVCNNKIDSIIQDVSGVKKGNIYLAKIVSIEPSLNAVFLNFGSRKNGFLTLDNIHISYFKNERRDIKNLELDQLILVQIEKEERGSKGAFLTTYTTLSGRYCILMIDSKNSNGGVSKKIIDSEERKRLLDIKAKLKLPEGMSIILRTAVCNVSEKQIKSDCSALLKIWKSIQKKAMRSNKVSLIHEEANGIIKIIRDSPLENIREIAVQNKKVLQEVKKTLQIFGEGRRNILLSLMNRNDSSFFFNKAFINHIYNLIAQRVNLENGGYIIISPTDALTAIDVNSAKIKGADNIEDMSFNLNYDALRASCESVLRRNISGQIVIDFVDMQDDKKFEFLQAEAKKMFEYDKSRVKFGKIGNLRLLEMSRQRIGRSVYEWLLEPCKECICGGLTLNVSFFARKFLREIFLEMNYRNERGCRLTVHKNVLLYIVNEKMDFIIKLKEEFDLNVKLADFNYKDVSCYKIDWY